MYFIIKLMCGITTFVSIVVSFVLLLIIIHDLLFFKQKTAYEMRISDWSSDVCSSDLQLIPHALHVARRLDLALLFASGGWVSRDAATAASGEDFGEEGGEEEAIGVRGLLDARASALRFVIGNRLVAPEPVDNAKIGRASCRERVCE